MLAALIPVLGPILEKVLGAVLPDPEAKTKAINAILSQLQAADLAQIDVNKAEAQNSNLFVAGWRPMIGWSCAAALAFQYVVTPVVMWLAGIFGWNIPMPPALDAILWELMFGMLGMGALRTFEKIKNVAR